MKDEASCGTIMREIFKTYLSLPQVKYSLDDDGGLRIDFEAMTTKATPICMTNHCFFNLAGHVSFV